MSVSRAELNAGLGYQGVLPTRVGIVRSTPGSTMLWGEPFGHPLGPGCSPLVGGGTIPTRVVMAEAVKNSRRDLSPQRLRHSPGPVRASAFIDPASEPELNPMPFEAAAQMEKDLAEDLRAEGYTVTGGT